MALEGLPPWLQVSPRDFVLAAAQGAQLGHQIADSTMRAWEEQARMRMASQEAEARRQQAAYQHEVETAANRLAADRLEQYRQSEIANRKAELGLRGQGLDIERQGLTMRGEREADLQGAREARIKDAEQAGRDRLAQVDFMNQMRQREADRRDKEFERRQKEDERARGTAHYITGPDNLPYVVMPGSTNAVPVNIQKPAAPPSEPSALVEAFKKNISDNWNFLKNPSASLSGAIPPTPTASPSDASPAIGQSFAPQETQAAPPPIAAPLLSKPSTNEVIRTTKDGRKAVFDADSKQFIRYAD